ncbi:endonuclease/exonuclease/phosphatase family protein [Sabulilitoribacter arenilitoris]|uniref:Endonuclease/exonuclease/phosphatase family protein n=1 Tax=Wocania arenilitoris TaxID=2044858 RepID=A0AAE3EQW1_9FLAO|nr:endonuclease/exonuclease/phosphatase family protein [Wocania arenilitoris]MCF7568395.1 endonuclease/exonuclease/phosphatase family protein [Wocania arenilitoris]
MVSKYYNFIVLIFFIGVFGFSQQDSKTVKIISYNIWNGYDFGKDEKRRAQVVNWIDSEQPTIVGLQELVNYTPKKLEEDANNWGHLYSVLLKEKGYSVGLTSKSPIEVKETIFEDMHHGALHCKTGGFDVFVIHFSPSSYKKRQQEAEIILKKLKEVVKSNPNYIVMGDFNALSPMDADLYKNDVLLNRLRLSNKDKGGAGNLAHNELDYSVISSFMAFPLIDACQKFTNTINERGSFPGRILGKVNSESVEELVNRLQRIDYIFLSPLLSKKLSNAQVYNKEPNWYLSDHYPVGVELKMQ